eukprot:snap_masked-scaffold_14-processed-gene-8.18-mRNA-1 protein AED:0.38 eAED:0.39 QI:0/-1/0/1/-1/1/1/0/94
MNRFLNTRSEVLSLYRECLKVSRSFYWANENGEEWSKILKESTRKEFEMHRHQTDPVEITRLLVVGRHCLEEIKHKFNATEEKMKEHMQKTKLR